MAAFLRCGGEMHLCCLILLACVIAAAGLGAEAGGLVRSELADELRRATELENQGKIKESEHTLLNFLRSVQDSESLEQALVLNNLGILYSTTDRHPEAEALFERSVRLLEKLPGEVTEQVLLKAKLHLACVYIETNRLKKAIKADIPSLLDKMVSPDDRTRARSVLGAIAALRRDYDSAERIYLDILSFWMEPSRAPKSQLEIATVQNNLGVLAMWQGRLTTARERINQSLATWQALVGPDSPMLARAMANVGAVCLEAKQYREAADWLARAASLARRTVGEFNPLTVNAQFFHAQALKKMGRKSEANEIARSAKDAYRMMRSLSVSEHTVDYRDLMKAGSNATGR
jgi:tetratricopeptide (TPR) repeat protein